MGVLESISEKWELNLDLINKCFREALSGLESREKKMNAIQDSMAESSKQLDLTRQRLEARLKVVEDKKKEVGEKERDFHLAREKGFKELELKGLELKLIRWDIMGRQEKLNEQEKSIEALFEKIELERKEFVNIRELLDERFAEISTKERHMTLIKTQIDSRATELDKSEESLERRMKDIELSEAALASKKEDIMIRQAKLNEEEKLIEAVFEKIELERKESENSRKLLDDRFAEIGMKERDMDLIKMQIDNRATELDKRQESLERRLKEIELREAALASRTEDLEAKEKVVDTREKILYLREELKLKEMELVSIKKSEGRGCDKLDSLIPTASEELRKESRKRLMDSSIKSREIGVAEHNASSKRICHVDGSSSTSGKGGDSAPSNTKSASTDYSGSKENQVNLQASCSAPANNSAQVLINEVFERDSHLGENSVSNAIDYTEALINDFEKQRSKECFKASQIWACYDDDYMTINHGPRLYVRIKEVFVDGDTGFTLQAALLEPVPYGTWNVLYKDWEAWRKAGLPIGCGSFRLANGRLKYLISHIKCAVKIFTTLSSYIL